MEPFTLPFQQRAALSFRRPPMSHQQSQPKPDSDAAPQAGDRVTLEVIESLKKEVDSFIRSDAQLAFERAETAYQLSLQSPDPLARALGSRARAQALHVLGRYAEATDSYQQARQIYHDNDKPVEAARVARAIIDALMYQGAYDQALALAGEAREVFIRHDEKLLAAQLESNVGNIYHRLDKYQEALGCYERAQETFAALDDQNALATAAYNAANIHSSLDNFRRARDLYQKSLELFEAQGNYSFAASARYALGYLRFLTGEFHQAIRMLHEVRAEFFRIGDEPGTALCDMDLAEIHLQLRVLDEAATLAQQARQQFQKLGMRFESAKALTFFGLTRLQQERFAEAEQMLREANDEFTSEGNEIYLGLTNIYLADLLLKSDRPAGSLSLARQSEELFSRQNLKTKTSYARMVAAKALLSRGDADQARELAESALETSKSLEAPWLKFQAHELLGDVLSDKGETDQAHEQYKQAVANIERIRSGIRVDEYRSAFFKDNLRVYEKLIRLCLDSRDSTRQAEAFFYLESCKARTLVDLLVNQLEAFPANGEGIPDDLIHQWRQIREELNWFYNKVGQNESSNQSRRLTVASKVWEEIDSRERALAEVLRRIQIHDPHFVWLNNTTGVTVKELCEVLDEDEAVIEYYPDDEGLKIFVIDRNGLRVVKSDCGRRQVREQALKLRLQLEKFQYGEKYISTHAGSLLSSVNGCLRDLHQTLFAPVAPLVESKKLIFIPFDLLHNVPFHALFDGETYLLERHEISYAPSARLLTLFAAEHHQPLDTALIFGASDEYTPKINEEINSIRALYPNASCFTGNEATAQSLTRHVLGKDIVHIASHAVFRHDNPMFSAFRLADAWLNFYDVCALDLRSSLVTLSGCSTGANQIHAGDELLGLIRGFLSAGAGSLVVSLWEVSDPVTAKLMAAFYKRLQSGLPPQTALRAAELEIRLEYAHPYYWAPFVFIGRAWQLQPAPLPPKLPNQLNA